MNNSKGKRIVGYHKTPPTWRLVDASAYKKGFDHELAIHYLKNEIYESVDREMQHILSGKFSGFYAGLRFLFAELTYLSNLYWGNPSKESAHVARYMRKFKILYPECGVHYEVFRHGLMHTHHPKWVKKGNKVIGWYISNTAGSSENFGVFIPDFSQQVKNAINEFVSELKAEKTNGKRNRLDKFYKGYITSAKILTRIDLKEYARSDFGKLRI